MIIIMISLSAYRSPWSTPILLLIFFSAFNLLEASLPSWLSKVCPVVVVARRWVFTLHLSLWVHLWVVPLVDALGSIGVDGLFILLAAIMLLWLGFALGMQSQNPLRAWFCRCLIRIVMNLK